MPLTKIKSLGITDGTIVNADINASAAIDASKLTGISSDYVLLATTDASNVSTVTFDGYFSSTYTNYIIFVSDYYHASADTSQLMRLRRSNADVTASNYNNVAIVHSSAGADSASVTTQSSFNINLGAGISGTSTNVTVKTITIYNPLNTTSHKTINYYGYSIRNDGVRFTYMGGGNLTDNTTALSGVSFFSSSGNIYGKFKLYGIK